MPRSPFARRPGRILLLLVSTWLAAPRAGAGGFDFPHQSARALGMGDAAVAATVDVSAIYYNPGALVLVEEKKHLALGAVGSGLGASLYQGLPPGFGAGTNGEQESVSLVAPHLFVAKPLGSRLAVGLGVFSPFNLKTEWQHPGAFAGRRVSLASDIQTYDLNPTLSWRLAHSVGLGLGLVYRTASVEHQRRLPLTLDGQLVDVASETVDTSLDSGLGWNVGLLFHTGKRLRWGLSYRSAIAVDFDGEARLTQISTGNTQVDQTVRATLPFDRDLPVVTSLKLPETLTLGVAWRLTQSATLEIDAVHTGWSRFEGLELDFVGQPQLSYSVPERFDDSMSYRAGLAVLLPSHWEWRFGVAFDESPQPAATVGPFLPDAERNTVSVGVGRDWLDLAISYQVLSPRTVVTNVDGINGRWRSHSWLVGLTISH